MIEVSYSPVADLVCMVFAFVFLTVLRESYIKFSSNFRIFKASIGLILFSSAMKIFWYQAIITDGGNPGKYYLMFHNISLICILQLFVIYISNLTIINHKQISIVVGVVDSIGILISLIEPSTPYFMLIIYCINACIMFGCCLINNKFIFRQLRFALIVVSIISLYIVTFEELHFQTTTYMTFTLILPLLVVMIMVHSNPYNLELGALNLDSFITFIKYKKDTKFVIIILKDYTFNNLPEEYKSIGKKLCSSFKRSSIFNPYPNMLIIVTRKLGDIEDVTDRFNLDKKIIKVDNSFSISSIDYFNALVELIDKKIPWNTIYTVNDGDYDIINKYKDYLKKLRGIYDDYDLNDERVLVYCQPILNANTNKFDTAEALMRIKVGVDFIYPNDFIPILEKYNLIHKFSMIMLNKLCIAVKDLNITRISINFSVEELKEINFIDDFTQIVKRNNIDFSKIGVEFTESRNDTEFNLLKEAVEKLQSLGCTVYLDDFGTGYSNFDRVLGLGMDVIKFDRSLLLLADHSQNGKYVIESFSETFDKLGFKVLYEGVETDVQEKLCIASNADYLQGYKYSKPIPIERLCEFVNS